MIEPLSDKEVQEIEEAYAENPRQLRPEFDGLMRVYVYHLWVLFRLHLALRQDLDGQPGQDL